MILKKIFNQTNLNIIPLVCQTVFMHTNPQLLWDNVLPNYMYFLSDLGLAPVEV